MLVRSRLWYVFLLLEIELVVLQILRWPAINSFWLWGFGDPRASFVLNHLIVRGLRSNTDFGCNFGLMSAAFARVIYGSFG
jgi:hypothetical protein